jgi:biopolymer transport protein ExbD
MESSSFSLGESGSDQLFSRRLDPEPPEFDITAMVDLVFMMNIYFLVTFVTVAMGELNLPTAKHVAALDADSAVIFTVTRTLDGKSINLYIGDGAKSEPITDSAQQEKRVQEAVEQAKASAPPKTEILLKAEKKVRLADLFRVATAASAEGMKLHVAVVERDKE